MNVQYRQIFSTLFCKPIRNCRQTSWRNSPEIPTNGCHDSCKLNSLWDPLLVHSRCSVHDFAGSEVFELTCSIQCKHYNGIFRNARYQETHKLQPTLKTTSSFDFRNTFNNFVFWPIAESHQIFSKTVLVIVYYFLTVLHKQRVNESYFNTSHSPKSR